MPVQPLFEEFLYIDPDTGMTVCMIGDESGFRPATAQEEMASVSLAHLKTMTQVASPAPLFDEFQAVDELIARYEHSFCIPPPTMA